MTRQEDDGRRCQPYMPRHVCIDFTGVAFRELAVNAQQWIAVRLVCLRSGIPSQTRAKRTCRRSSV